LTTWGRWGLLGFLCLTPLLPAQPGKVKVRRLDLEPLSPARVDQLNEAAREAYQQGMVALDRVNYPLALEFFQRAVREEPDNIYLRFQVVQVAHYLGDTRSVDKHAIRYYDIAEDNLRAMTESDALNEREKGRAAEAIEMVQQLRRSASERDEKRRTAGRELAEEIRKELYLDLKEKEKDLRQQREEMIGERRRMEELRQTQGSRGGSSRGGMMGMPGMAPF